MSDQWTWADTLPSGGGESGLLAERARRLKPGEILCGGWLGGQLSLMEDGMTGRLPEYSVFFHRERDGWLDPTVRDGWEEVPYWLRGAYPLGVLTRNRPLLEKATAYIESAIGHQHPDGWFGPDYLKSYGEADGMPVPDIFPHMIFLWAVIFHYEYTRDSRVLPFMERFFRFCRAIPDACFLPKMNGRIRWEGIRGGDMLPVLYWLYDRTGEPWLLELAERFYRGIWRSHSRYVAHHAVDFAQRFAYDALYFRQSKNREDWRRSERYYQEFQEAWGRLPGGIFAADEQIREGCTDPRQAYEPCGMVELAKNFYDLARISGDGRYFDRTEAVMLNHFPASFSPDYRQVHYLTAPNAPKQSNYYHHPTCNGGGTQRRSFQIFTPNNRCCGHNTGMGWTWYGMNLWQKTADHGLAACLYADCRVETEIDGESVQIRERTDYPFSGTVKITVEQGPKKRMPLYFRVPEWCRKLSLQINSRELRPVFQSGGFLKLERIWQAGDAVEIRLSMAIARESWSNGSLSIRRGPLYYSLKIGEDWRVVEDAGQYRHPTPHLWENYEVWPSTPWNVGLYSPDGRESAVSVRVREVKETVAPQPWTLQEAPVVLEARVRQIPNWGLQDDTAAPLQPSPVFSGEETAAAQLIPLGCARLRISCFPIVSGDPRFPQWRSQPGSVPPEDRPQKYPDPYLTPSE